jgi:hypothetical protein
VNFEPDARQQYLKLLGYSHSSVTEQVNEVLQKNKQSKLGQQGVCDDDDDAENVSVHSSALLSLRTCKPHSMYSFSALLPSLYYGSRCVYMDFYFVISAPS